MKRIQHIGQWIQENRRNILPFALIVAILMQPFTPLVVYASGPVVGDIFTFSSTGGASWTVPAGVASVTVKAWGAGGSAGTGEKITDAHRSGLGGGAGAYVEKTISVNPGDTYSLSVGVGGQGIQDVAHGRVGNPGGETRFEGNGTTLVAGGGLGGTSFTGHGNPTNDLGSGGIAQGGDVNLNGGSADPYIEVDGNPYASKGGSAPNGGAGGDRGRCGRDGICPGSEAGTSPAARDGGFPGGGGGGSDVAAGGFGANGQVTIQVVSLVPVSDANPVGFFETADCSALVGWASDADTPGTSLTIHVYKDGDASTGTFVTSALADVSRQDVNTDQGVTGNHGFSIPVSASLKDGAAHSVYVYAINSSGNPLGNSLLTNSPKSITCAASNNGGGNNNGGNNGGTVNPSVAPTLVIDSNTISIPNGGVAAPVLTSNAIVTGNGTLTNHGIEMRVNGGAWSNAGAWTALIPNAPQTTGASFTALNLSQAGSYEFRAYASIDGGINYVYSANVTLTANVAPANGGNNTPAPVFTTPLTATPSTVVAGQAPALSWAASNASSCAASGGWTGNQLASGSVTVSTISANTTYTITCVGAGGSAVSSATVTFSSAAVVPSVSASLSANSGSFSISSGGIATPVFTSTATVTGNGTLTNHGIEMRVNGGAWSNAGAWTALIPNAPQTTGASFTALNLSQAGSYEFRAYASIDGGSTYSYSPIVTVAVNAVGGNNNGGNNMPAPSFTTSLSASPSTLAAGQTSTLTWATANATACTTSGGWNGSQPVSGTFVVGPIAANTSYTITCTGPGGSNSSSATITFNNGGGSGLTGSFMLSATTGVTSENGSSVPVNVTLGSAPIGNVTLAVMSSDFTEGTTSVMSLLFTPANWNVAQPVIITGQDDSIADGTISYNVTIGPSTSSDPNYQGLAAQTISLTNTDNESAPVVAPPVVASSGGGSGNVGGGGSSLVGGSSPSGPCVGNCGSVASGGTVSNDVWILIDSQPTTVSSAGPSAPRLVCPSVNLITKFLRINVDNDPNEVTKLQTFLNTYEAANIAVSGVFDAATESAVKAFQAKYAADILTPWGTTEPTGIVYITTSEKINRIYCEGHPDYAGNVLDNAAPVDSTQFEGVIGQATSTSTNIAGVFGGFTGRVFDALSGIPIYQLLILLLLLLGIGFIIQGTFKKDIQSYGSYVALMRGIPTLLVASVLNVFNTMSFMIAPTKAARIGLTMNWVLFLDLANAIVFIIAILAVFMALYGKMVKDKPDVPAAPIAK